MQVDLLAAGLVNLHKHVQGHGNRGQVLHFKNKRGQTPFTRNDLSGKGAAVSPGRWNEEGQTVVYCACTIAMAVLETSAHIDSSGLPLNRFLIGIDIPAELWSARVVLAVSSLPPAWRAIPAGRSSVSIGSGWWSSSVSAILEVPSAIVPEETTCILNSRHSDMEKVIATVIRPFEYDLLFR